jgi:hypothetical protein
MNKTCRIVVAGLGAMTPAFIATDHVQARSIADGATAPAESGAPAIAPDQEALKRALLELSPAEKLRIGGDRIRLAAKAKVSTQSSTRPGYSGVQTMTNPVRRCLGGQAPRQAR